ncbi:MAG TPA: right-handed parallel beta-helix repeat-containing protein [Thermoanaerobaculia bacterium]|nr:right-handed parallel beta-helix repeat-containing protein [Thermoanaerobaculia bacterium]
MPTKRSRYALSLPIMSLFTLFTGTQATWALATHTWVSATGSDSNACTRSAPCLTFSGALSQTAAGGEIDVLDSGDFGAVTIGKAISIVANGTVATIQVTSGNAITVSAGSSDVVVLRGLLLDGQGTATSGISFTAGGTLHIESCTVNAFSGFGIDIEPPSTTSKVFINDSIVRGNATGGIVIKPTGSSNLITASVDRTRMESNGGPGIKVQDLTNAVIRNSVSTENAANGFTIAKSVNNPQVLLENCQASNNVANGLAAVAPTGVGPPVFVSISNMVITGNGAGMATSGNASITSFGNNKNAFNTTDGSPNMGIPQQ